MIALKIEDIKEFTKQLFTGETFDRFLVQEASFTTFCTFQMDGRLKKGYFEEESEEYTAWNLLRPLCLQIIKGKRLPEKFSVVLKLPMAGTEKFVRGAAPNLPDGTIGGLYLNIRYGDNTLNVVTGTSYAQFTLDKSVEREWDHSVAGFLKKAQIAFSEMSE